ncbi:hypothetical protein TSOC_003211 [Tetrabaena socialis]|uniref:Flavin-containing monooxygenase n=1 Tax=Tetrabaena socialis TaxID=47790 RepID=A0A2J8AC39_9CHLO|nr:hypothetical protein TSOC_003211 [Tetrabaena socialis]|eukprot:PNH10085.1 hypothetical protein TSOC_003211 [Tetrabaena socialis]
MDRSDVLVVGAGPAGLLTTRALLAAGFQCLILEQSSDIGGWTREGVGPVEALQLSDANFNANAVLPPKPTVQDARSYLAAYASFYNLHDHTRLASKLVELRFEPRAGGTHGRWLAVYLDLQLGRRHTTAADFVVLCTGHTPPPEGCVSALLSPGEAHFAAGARVLAAQSATTRDVLGCEVHVIGDGASAVDTACSLALLLEDGGGGKGGGAVQLLLQQPPPLPGPTSSECSAASALPCAAAERIRLDGPQLVEAARRRALAAVLQPQYLLPPPKQCGGSTTRASGKRRFWGLLRGKAVDAPRTPYDGRRDDGGGPVASSRKPSAIAAAASAATAATAAAAAAGGGAPSPGDAPRVVLWAPSLFDPRFMPFLDQQTRRALLGNTADRRGVGAEHGAGVGDVSGSGLPIRTAAAAAAAAPAMELYRGIVHPDVPGLAFVGLQSHAASSPLVLELQAQWLAAHLAARLPQLPAEALRTDLQRQRAWRTEVLPPCPLSAPLEPLGCRTHEEHYVRQLTVDLEGVVLLSHVQSEEVGDEWEMGGRKAAGKREAEGVRAGTVGCWRRSAPRTPGVPEAAFAGSKAGGSVARLLFGCLALGARDESQRWEERPGPGWGGSDGGGGDGGGSRGGRSGSSGLIRAAQPRTSVPPAQPEPYLLPPPPSVVRGPTGRSSTGSGFGAAPGGAGGVLGRLSSRMLGLGGQGAQGGQAGQGQGDWHAFASQQHLRWQEWQGQEQPRRRPPSRGPSASSVGAAAAAAPTSSGHFILTVTSPPMAPYLQHKLHRAATAARRASASGAGPAASSRAAAGGTYTPPADTGVAPLRSLAAPASAPLWAGADGDSAEGWSGAAAVRAGGCRTGGGSGYAQLAPPPATEKFSLPAALSSPARPRGVPSGPASAAGLRSHNGGVGPGSGASAAGASCGPSGRSVEHDVSEGLRWMSEATGVDLSALVDVVTEEGPGLLAAPTHGRQPQQAAAAGHPLHAGAPLTPPPLTDERALHAGTPPSYAHIDPAADPPAYESCAAGGFSSSARSGRSAERPPAQPEMAAPLIVDVRYHGWAPTPGEELEVAVATDAALPAALEPRHGGGGGGGISVGLPRRLWSPCRDARRTSGSGAEPAAVTAPVAGLEEGRAHEPPPPPRVFRGHLRGSDRLADHLRSGYGDSGGGGGGGGGDGGGGGGGGGGDGGGGVAVSGAVELMSCQLAALRTHLCNPALFPFPTLADSPSASTPLPWPTSSRTTAATTAAVAAAAADDLTASGAWGHALPSSRPSTATSFALPAAVQPYNVPAGPPPATTTPTSPGSSLQPPGLEPGRQQQQPASAQAGIPQAAAAAAVAAAVGPRRLVRPGASTKGGGAGRRLPVRGSLTASCIFLGAGAAAAGAATAEGASAEAIAPEATAAETGGVPAAGVLAVGAGTAEAATGTATALAPTFTSAIATAASASTATAVASTLAATDAMSRFRLLLRRSSTSRSADAAAAGPASPSSEGSPDSPSSASCSNATPPRGGRRHGSGAAAGRPRCSALTPATVGSVMTNNYQPSAGGATTAAPPRSVNGDDASSSAAAALPSPAQPFSPDSPFLAASAPALTGFSAGGGGGGRGAADCGGARRMLRISLLSIGHGGSSGTGDGGSSSGGGSGSNRMASRGMLEEAAEDAVLPYSRRIGGGGGGGGSARGAAAGGSRRAEGPAALAATASEAVADKSWLGMRTPLASCELPPASRPPAATAAAGVGEASGGPALRLGDADGQGEFFGLGSMDLMLTLRRSYMASRLAAETAELEDVGLAAVQRLGGREQRRGRGRRSGHEAGEEGTGEDEGEGEEEEEEHLTALRGSIAPAGAGRAPCVPLVPNGPAPAFPLALTPHAAAGGWGLTPLAVRAAAAGALAPLSAPLPLPPSSGARGPPQTPCSAGPEVLQACAAGRRAAGLQGGGGGDGGGDSSHLGDGSKPLPLRQLHLHPSELGAPPQWLHSIQAQRPQPLHPRGAASGATAAATAATAGRPPRFSTLSLPAHATTCSLSALDDELLGAARWSAARRDATNPTNARGSGDGSGGGGGGGRLHAFSATPAPAPGPGSSGRTSSGRRLAGFKAGGSDGGPRSSASTSSSPIRTAASVPRADAPGALPATATASPVAATAAAPVPAAAAAATAASAAAATAERRGPAWAVRRASQARLDQVVGEVRRGNDGSYGQAIRVVAVVRVSSWLRVALHARKAAAAAAAAAAGEGDGGAAGPGVSGTAHSGDSSGGSWRDD